MAWNTCYTPEPLWLRSLTKAWDGDVAWDRHLTSSPRPHAERTTGPEVASQGLEGPGTAQGSVLAPVPQEASQGPAAGVLVPAQALEPEVPEWARVPALVPAEQARGPGELEGPPGPPVPARVVSAQVPGHPSRSSGPR